jgi:prepilin-type N-terminal cleavage/methylation domain-containing protein
MTIRISTRRRKERGFTLTEMLIATVVVMFGLVAVAQLVPTSVMLNSNNRSDGTALVFAQRQIDVMRAVPLSVVTFSDALGVSCPLGQTCQLGDPTQPLQVVGSPVVMYNGAPVVDFSASTVADYSFAYTDPNDPSGASYDVRWGVITNVNPATQVAISRRILLGVLRRGMQTPTLPITLDVQVEK